MKNIKPGTVVIPVLIWIMIAIMLIPMVWMLLVSFKPYESNVTDFMVMLTTKFTMENFLKILDTSRMGRWIFNSFLIAAVQSLVGILLASLAAFALSVIEFKGKKVVFFIILAGLMVPVEALIMPLFSLIISLDWMNTYAGLIMPGLAMPLAVIIFKQFYDGVPRELIEAANMDGAHIFWVWRKIFLPLSGNTTAALMIFLFIQSWNNFLWPMLVGTDSSMMTLTVALPVFQSTFSTDVTMPMTANVIASVPALIVFLVFQKQIVKGIAMTGIK
ncbi:carbohydrate ABC transporter permease [Anaerotalea alkaliphila]|nr:carbohydrate ABC transporter permease [Anaerotalea alkaliphila]